MGIPGEGDGTGLVGVTMSVLTVGNLQVFAWGAIDGTGAVDSAFEGPPLEAAYGTFAWLLVFLGGVLGLVGSTSGGDDLATDEEAGGRTVGFAALLCYFSLGTYLTLGVLVVPAPRLLAALGPGFWVLATAAASLSLAARSKKKT
ncbi:MAG: hypothetical protein Kow0069_06120 [Promethearchaeota archaeon]